MEGVDCFRRAERATTEHRARGQCPTDEAADLLGGEAKSLEEVAEGADAGDQACLFLVYVITYRLGMPDKVRAVA